MNPIENEKKVQKKLAQITIFQVVLVLSLPSYAQMIKKIEPSQWLTWMGFGIILSALTVAYVYKQRLKRDLLTVKSQDDQNTFSKSS